jgi:hypothetical protein
MYHRSTLALALSITSCFAAAVQSYPPGIPREASARIAQVQEAAKRKDYSALQNLMVQDFTWSFGGDGNAQEAIEAWKEAPASLARLAKVTRSKCGFVSKEVIQCPVSAGTSHRAGFKNLGGTWKMVYFVAGD